jgi:membrane protein DedA with SNARE-associated domain
MEIFQHYIAPLTHWLHINPHAALFITFLIAFTESLAIIGSIIPGSVTMTAIGILAGSGVIRIDLTFIAATLGAIAGDGASYLLGFYFRDSLVNMWPFSRYPNILAYGQVYFEKHGGKSVIIGRFVGPLRSIIPVIAGMMHMGKMRFFIANILSGIMWSFLYITPGILIGAASHELSPERATQFVLLILLTLISIWLLTIGIKALYLKCRAWFDKRLHSGWSKLLSTPYVNMLCKALTPHDEIHHTRTVMLLFFFMLSLAVLFLLYHINQDTNVLFLINHPIHLCLQSIRTHSFDLFFAITQQIMTPIPITVLSLSMIAYNGVRQDIKGLALWLSMMIISLTVIHNYQLLLHSSVKPPGILENFIDFSFPFTSVSLATATFLALFCHNYLTSHAVLRALFSLLLLSALSFGSLSYIYLGDLWFTDLLAAFFMGTSISLLYWIIYRKLHPILSSTPAYFSLIGICLLFLSTSFASYLHLNQSLQNHQIYFTQHVLSDAFWWNQEKPRLPVYSRNRVGKVISIFNVQYAGELSGLKHSLEKAGWKRQKSSLFHLVLKQVEGRARLENPLAGSVYLHRKPTLTMTYAPPHATTVVRLQLWRSNYYLNSFDQPIWLGHVQLLNRSFNRALYAQDPAIKPLRKCLHHFQTKLLPLPASGPRPNSLIKANYILLIQPQTMVSP